MYSDKRPVPGPLLKRNSNANKRKQKHKQEIHAEKPRDAPDIFLQIKLPKSCLGLLYVAKTETEYY